ncbi:MAG: MASE1 domain-containing protein, partial [Cyclobacteriaceae bacterium]|nr:MASE1 domain-containing protein [Cyclobacteriaceae bacterium]
MNMLRKALDRLVKSNDLKIIYVAIFIIVSAQIGFALNFENSNAMAIWPPVGVAFALVLLLGDKIWPGIVIGGFITYSISFINQEIVISVSSIASISIITIGVVFEVLVGFYLYRYLIKEGNPYDKTANAFKFLIISLTVCLIGAATYTGSLSMIGAIEKEGMVQIFINSYLGSVAGLLLFTNVIIAWVKGKTHWTYSIGNVLEALAFTGSIIAILYFLKSNSLPLSFERSFSFLIIPFLLWAAFSVNIQIAISFVVLISLFSLYITKLGSGPFLLENPQDTMFLLQIFIGVITISTIILSASVFERTEAK